MRFEELAYTVDGLPVTVPFTAGLTVVHVPADDRDVWVARLLGVLEGFRAGDGASVVWVDHAEQRIRMTRDEHGAASLSNAESDAELHYYAAHLSLDGRFDWFASIGITGRAAAELMVVDPEVFTGAEDVDRDAVEAELAETRKLLARSQRQFRAATARCRQAQDLRRRIDDLDELTTTALPAAVDAAEAWRLAVERAADSRRALGSATRLDADGLTRALARPADVAADLESLAAACRAAAQRRDELVVRLQGSESDVREADMVRQLTDEVEPAVVEALAGLAVAVRPFDVIVNAARLEAAGVTDAGIARLTADVLAEVAARVEETAEAHRQQTLDDAEADCREAQEALERHLSAAGLPTDGTEDLAARLEALPSRADAVAAERAGLFEELAQIEWDLPDLDHLAARQSALHGQVATLETSLRTGRCQPSVEAVEAVLLARAAQVRRIGRRREPLPLVVNTTLDHFGADDRRSLLSVAARLAETTQVLYLTDDADTLAWASEPAEPHRIAGSPLDGIATFA